MISCPQCRAPVAKDARFCGACGALLDGDRTIASGAEPDATIPSARPRDSRPASATPTSDPWHGAAWGPGALVAGRYRIVALLGKGGMGEVYRADDLTLGQSVALKFLPSVLARDADRQRRFFQEVRVARELSHPNVCRVYDVGETEGRPFLSMEFIDGEDLASLLRRIGRLPQEKGVEIARQLCAGLSALHDKGVIHRDLKPANVMLDGRGRVRLTDFGLAALVEDIAGTEVRAGTPAYMAPEQLRGERVDTKSDLFALGLLLYEIFTGKRAYASDNPVEISRLHRDSTPRSASTILPDLDPAIERVIDRCLQTEPSSRPASALHVAAALPGGDPLAAALAAGEVPSIEMVAAAGSAGSVRAGIGILCVLATAAAIVLIAQFGSRQRVHYYDPMQKSGAVLQDRAREVLATLGHAESAEDSDSGFGMEADVLRWIAKTDTTTTRWETLRAARPPALIYWYRQSPRQLIPMESGASISTNDPPLTVARMATVFLDTRGRLQELNIVPPETGGWDSDTSRAETNTPPNWRTLFQIADLDTAQFRSVAPEWLAPVFVDTLLAWRGAIGDSTEIVVHAGATGGRWNHFAMRGPWSRSVETARETRTMTDRVIEGVFVVAILSILLAGFLLALRNLRLGRGDRAGARRIAVFAITLTLVSWIVRVNHAPGPADEVNMFLAALGPLLLVGGFLWAFYLALEPYARKTWPERLVGWSRLLTGRLRDPLVGRDILAGGVYFFATTAIQGAVWFLAEWRGLPPPRPDVGRVGAFLGVGNTIGLAMEAALNAVFVGMFLFVMLLLLRLLVRNLRVTAVIWVVLYALVAGINGGEGAAIYAGAAGAVVGLLSWIVLFRFGFLAFIVGQFFTTMTNWFPITLDSSDWYSANSAFAIFTILGLMAYGFWIALAGKSIFGDEELSR